MHFIQPRNRNNWGDSKTRWNNISLYFLTDSQFHLVVLCFIFKRFLFPRLVRWTQNKTKNLDCVFMMPVPLLGREGNIWTILTIFRSALRLQSMSIIDLSSVLQARPRVDVIEGSTGYSWDISGETELVVTRTWTDHILRCSPDRPAPLRNEPKCRPGIPIFSGSITSFIVFLLHTWSFVQGILLLIKKLYPNPSKCLILNQGCQAWVSNLGRVITV